MSSSTQSNVNSSASLMTSFRVWCQSIPLVTRFILFICCGIQLSAFIFGGYNSYVCQLPAYVLYKYQLYRLFLPAWFHVNLIHLFLNMMTFLPMGRSLERIHGSLHFLYIILMFDLLSNIIHTGIAWFASGVAGYYAFMGECAVGFSGVIFSLLVLNTAQQSPQDTRSIFGFFTVPAKLYPWILLILLQIIMPGISFLGHLSGIFVGYLYILGFLNWFLPSSSFMNSVESSRGAGWIVMKEGYISNPHLGSLPTVNPRSNTESPGVFSQFARFFQRVPVSQVTL